MITDYYSRKIVGYWLNDSLEAQGPIKALKMALRQVKDCSTLIHHSDRGIQYACSDYIDILLDNKIQVSMTEENHVYENALAERVNGILKDEFLLGETFLSKEQALKAVNEAVSLYNNKRPHLSLNYKTPAKVYAA